MVGEIKHNYPKKKSFNNDKTMLNLKKKKIYQARSGQDLGRSAALGLGQALLKENFINFIIFKVKLFEIIFKKIFFLFIIRRDFLTTR